MKRVIAISGALLLAAAADAALLYSRNTETGSRANCGGAGFTAGAPADPNRMLIDDVPIPVARLAGFEYINVTRVTVGIRRFPPAGGVAPATDVSVFWSTFTTAVTAPDTQVDTPPNLIGTVSLPSAAASATNLVTIGDGVTPMFTVPLNMTLIGGFGTMGIGVRLSSTDTANGWRITSGPDANATGAFWMYDPGHTAQANDEGAYNFGTTVPSSFYIIVEGDPVPEPASLALLALGALFLRRR